MSGGLLTAISAVGVVVGIWNFVCNERTYRDRTRLAAMIFSGPDWQEKKRLFEKVSYHDHLRHRFFLLDPFRLYSPRIFQ